MLIVRDARLRDRRAMLDVILAAYAEHGSLEDPPSSGLGETEASIEAAMRTARAAIAEEDGVAIGVVFFEPYVDYMTLFRLAVIPTARRRGVGAALVAHVEQRAREDGVASVRLTARWVLPRTIAYYEARAYRVTGRTVAHALLEKAVR